jgi:hypothetical protein
VSAVPYLVPVDGDPDLDTYLDWTADNGDPEVGPPPPPEPTIADLDRADRALRKLARIQAAMAEVDRLYEARLMELDAWREDARQRYGRAASWLNMQLRAFHEARVAEDPKAKTIRLPAGELRSRQGRPRWEVIDEDRLVDWATVNGHHDVLRLVVDKSALKSTFEASPSAGRAFTADGEAVPGIVVHAAERSYTPAPNPIGGAE